MTKFVNGWKVIRLFREKTVAKEQKSDECSFSEVPPMLVKLDHTYTHGSRYSTIATNYERGMNVQRHLLWLAGNEGLACSPTQVYIRKRHYGIDDR